MNRFLSLFCAVLMAVASVRAEEPASITPLTIGDNSVFIYNPTENNDWWYNIENASHYTLFSYTAQADCGVIIYADGDKDTYGVLLDKNMNIILGSDDGYNMDFLLATDVKAGDVYYIGARGYGEEIGSYTIKVEEKTTPEAVIGDRIYYTLNNAINDAKDGKTVTLIADIEYICGGKTEYDTNGTITLDLNGYTMYGWIKNYGHLTIEDSSEGKTGKMITLLDRYKVLFNDESENSITINGGTFIGAQVTSSGGVFYINGGTFILPDESTIGRTMSNNDNIVFGDGVVYRDLSGEHDDISEVTEDVTYSGTFVKAGTPTGIKDVDASKAQKTIKTVENGKVVIIKNGEKFDLAGKKL
ncbi:MAG: hypothetical protein MJZ01_04880 [Bacteroidales bacterium]|nr:hypothetical protein [Bacteroidales bacterium]